MFRTLKEGFNFFAYTRLYSKRVLEALAEQNLLKIFIMDQRYVAGLEQNNINQFCKG